MLRGTDAPPNAIWIDSLDLSKMVQRRQTPRAGRSLAGGRGGRGAGEAGGPQGAPITLGGVTYAHGIGTLSINELIIDLKGQATRFLAMVGLNDNASRQGSVTVEVWLDNKKVLISDVLRVGSPPLKVDVDLTGARFLELLIDDGNDVSTGDNADWAGGLIFLKAGATEKPESWTFPSEPRAADRVRMAGDAANQPAAHHRRHARPSVHLPRAGDRRGAADVRRAQSSGRPHARSENRRHHAARSPRAGRTDVEITVTQRARQGRPHADHRRWTGRARAHAAARLELVERLGPIGRRSESTCRGRRDGVERPRRTRLSVRQHRRRVGRDAATRTRRPAAEREVPGHEGAHRTTSTRKGSRPASTRRRARRRVRDCRAASASRRSTRARGASGASICSSTTGARTAARCPISRSPISRSPTSSCARRSNKVAARHRLQPLPVRHGQRLGMGRAGRRQLLAHDRRPHRRLVEHGRGRFPSGGARDSGRSRATGPIPTCSSSAKSAGGRTSTTRA